MKLHRPKLLRMPTSLRGKTILIIFTIVVGLVGGLYLLSRLVLLRGFSNLEEDLARQDMENASSSLSNELVALDHIVSEYAAGAQTYAYLRGQNRAYVRSEFSAATLQHLKVSFVVILDESGRKVFSRGCDQVTGKETECPSDLDDHLNRGSPLVTRSTETNQVMGILMLESGPVLVDSRPVLTSDAGPVAGTLVMGRSLDAAVIQAWAVAAHKTINLQRLDGGALPPDFRSAAGAISQQESIEVQVFNKDFLAAYKVLKDIYGKPAVVLRVLLPRTVYQQENTSLLQYLLLMLAASLGFGAVTLYLLERVVLSRVANLSESITQIGTSGNLSARLEVKGKDELAFLGSAINGMLEDLERAQIERHEGRTRLGVMVENMPAILWTTDMDLRFTSSMGAGLQALGLRKNEVVGQSLYEYFRTEDPEFPPIAAHRSALRGESVSYEFEWQRCVLESHLQPLRSSEARIVGVIGVALDITERKHLADQLRLSQKMQAVGELAGGVAHDFNNLLMVVKGHAEIVLSRLPDSSALKLNVEQMDKAADRAASLTRQLLAFSRMQVLYPRVLDLNDVVGSMIKMFSRVIGENIEMAFLPGANLGRVKADAGQIEQVLLNLVVNARDAMPDGGKLTIETSNINLDQDYAAKHPVVEPGPYVMLTVTDTGCGMDAETQSRIFEPFFTTKTQGKGTGLGLATAYGFVKQSGGFIWVYSETGRGTTFKVYLPQVDAEVEKPLAEKAATGPPPGSETILFVEDDESVRELVRDYLRSAGYRVLEASDGIRALEASEAHKGAIQILITDVVMPRLSGRELAARISARRPNVKVLYISGYTDDSVLRHGMLEDGAAFLQKPFNLKSLAQKVREVLDGQPEGTVVRGSR